MKHQCLDNETTVMCCSFQQHVKSLGCNYDVGHAELVYVYLELNHKDACSEIAQRNPTFFQSWFCHFFFLLSFPQFFSLLFLSANDDAEWNGAIQSDARTACDGQYGVSHATNCWKGSQLSLVYKLEQHQKLDLCHEKKCLWECAVSKGSDQLSVGQKAKGSYET